MIPSTHLSLLVALKGADQRGAAWERFQRLYHNTIFRWCVRRRLQPADAEDVTQAVWARLLRALPEHQHDPSRPFRSWLKAVVANAIRDLFRMQRRRPADRGIGGSDVQDCLAAVADADDLAEVIEGQEDSDLTAAVERVKARVGEATWQAFWFLAVDELPAAEAASRLGMSTASVYQAKYRTSRLLVEEYSSQREQGPTRPGGPER
jgi:RNA polymerase sigma-70 factor (ECF subfamily)